VKPRMKNYPSIYLLLKIPNISRSDFKKMRKISGLSANI